MLSIRPFLPSPDAYADLAALWNALQLEWPRHPAVWKRIDDRAEPGGCRFLAEQDGQLVGACDVRPADSGSYDLSVVARPQVGGAGALAPLYDAMCEALRPSGRVVLRAYVADSRPWLLTFLADRGFTCVQKTAYSRLDVDAFELGPHERSAASVLGEGFRVASLQDLAKQDADWQRKYWKLNGALLQEIPFEGGFRQPTLEAFSKDLSDPDQFNLAASFVASEGGDYVALSRLQTWSEIPSFAFNNLTGTRALHRRRGLATFLKLATIAYAQHHGHRSIITLNDIDNPMLHLNHTLGFETQHIQHTLRAEV